MITINFLIERYSLEELEQEIYSILGNNNIPKEKKLVLLGENYRPKIDYVRADLLIKLYKQEKLMSKKSIKKRRYDGKSKQQQSNNTGQ